MYKSTKETLSDDISDLKGLRFELTDSLRLNSSSNSLAAITYLKKQISDIDILMEELANKINEKEIL